MKEIYATRKNFLLVQERESTKGAYGRTVIKFTGYTNTAKALRQNWILTQLQTVPHKDRSHLPDPFMGLQKVFKIYDELDCNVFNVFFLPECKGVNDAAQELVNYLEHYFYPTYPRHAMIWHSKGVLFGLGSVKYLDTNENIVIISPTIGMGVKNEQQIYEEIQNYIESKPTKFSKWLANLQAEFLLKPIIHVTYSRRPIDYDMTVGSEYLNKLDLAKLFRHKTLLITAEDLYRLELSESFAKCYEFLGLNGEKDKSLALKYLGLIADWVDEVITIKATHSTEISNAMPYVKRFLYEI